MKATPHGSRRDHSTESARRAMVPALVPAWATAGAVVLMTWLLRELARRCTSALPHLAASTPRIESTGARPYGIASILKPLAAPAGVGVVGPGANTYVRALLVEVLTTGIGTVMIGRDELDRLFEGDFDHGLQRALAPRLHVSELLEDAVEHLELQLLIDESAQANPDVGSSTSSEQPTAYWIATPGHDDDVVQPLLRRVPRLVGVMFGEWRHGPTYVVDATGTLNDVWGFTSTLAIGGITATPTPAQALARLRAYASTSSASG